MYRLSSGCVENGVVCHRGLRIMSPVYEFPPEDATLFRDEKVIIPCMIDCCSAFRPGNVHGFDWSAKVTGKRGRAVGA